MRSVTYSMGVSLDGYIAGPDGGFDWTAPGPRLGRPEDDLTRSSLVFEFSHEVPGVIGLPSCHGHDPLVLDDTLAWASVRKCPLNPAR
jgi:hypothetical protein